MNSVYRQRIRRIVFSAAVGALYAALTVAFAPLSFGPLQFRFSEALCILPFYAPETALGLFAGCLLANLMSPYGLTDIIFGSLATLAAVLLVARSKRRPLAPLPVVLCNAVIIGTMLAFVHTPDNAWQSLPILIAQVGAEQAVVCYGLGLPLLYALPRIPYFRQLFPKRFMKENSI